MSNPGIGVALSAVVNHRRAELYHLRLIYDTVSLAGYAGDGLQFLRCPPNATKDLVRWLIKLVMLQYLDLASHVGKLLR